ncbi:nucleotidyltransferase family protein [Sphingobium aquiterrae]|uniref:nucleotidyltransferase family protein n=1 Tax=Sphingobium aquiterrae TaxID=2038656 RepID=UPI0030185DCC
MRPERIAAILLAAGPSTRFGEDDKLMVDYRGKPLINHALAHVASLPFAHMVAVARPMEEAPVIHRKLDRRGYEIVVKEDAAADLSASIALGLARVEEIAAIRKVQGVLLCLADMPDCNPTHLNHLCLAAEDIRSVVASTDGFGPLLPAFIGRKHFRELMSLRGDQGPRVLMSHGKLIETSDAVLRDVDTPEDLSRTLFAIGGKAEVDGNPG